MKVQGNVGTLAVTYKETETGYKQDLWFRKYTITNIIVLKNLMKQYQVTYERIDQILVVHKEDQEKPNMAFNIHESGLHCYNPTNKSVLLINNISKNKQGFPRDKLTVQSTWLQGAFSALVAIFDRVGLRTNAGKTVSMAYHPCRAGAGNRTEAGYSRRLTGVGKTYAERQRERVACG